MPARLRRVAAALLALGVLGSGPLPARAIDDTPPVSLPDEPPVQTLPGRTFDAIALDLDGDGAGELVRLTDAIDGSGTMRLEVWTRQEGEAVPAFGAAVRRDASVEERLTARPRPSADNQLPVLVNDAARLLVLRDGARRRVVLAAIGAAAEDARPCCLTLYEVAWPPARSGLARLGGIQQDAEAVMAADLDGDGTDELLAIEAADDGGSVPVRVYHLFGDRPRTESVSIGVAAIDVANAVVGETDGVPGDDVVAVATHTAPGQGPATWLVRVARGADGLRADTTPLGEPAIPFVLPWATTPLLLSLPLRDTADAVSWPARGTPRRLHQLPNSGSVVATVGSGAGTRVLFRPDDDPGHLLPLDAGLGPGTPIEGRVAATSLDGASLEPYVGVWPTTPDRAPALVFLGRRIDRDGRASDGAALFGARPLGTVGSGGGTTALLADAAPRRAGDPRLLAAQPGAILRLVPSAALRRPEANGGALRIGLRGAAFAPDDPNVVVTPGAAFSLLVDAPPGSRLVVSLDSNPELDIGREQAVTGGLTVLRVELADTATRLAVAVVTPTGATYRGSWQVEQRTGPPSLVLDVPILPLSASVRIAGTTDPGNTVTAAGEPIEVDAAGAFALRVAGTLAPTSIVVEAVDPVGNRHAETLSIVGWVDYRRLPWTPIVVLAVMGVALALWLRVPRPRSWVRRDAEDDAILEEIDA
ncbi:MAG: hypothetical protein ABI622_09310 [Chloroflexota bacterium]